MGQKNPSEKGMNVMANNRQSTNSYLFRIIVTPAVLLCVIFRKQAFQWIAVSAIAVWLMIVLISALKRSGGRKKRRHTEKKLAKLSADISSDAQPEAETPESELFLIRQINIRITEQLKVTFPMVSWLWVRRPSASEICAGGTWRIQTSNTEPFNYGEVAITKQGRISITMLQATPLGEASELPEVDNLKPDEMLDRVDVKAWYRDEGERILADMIDDLNTQGHRQLIIHEDGEVCVERSGVMKPVETIRNFPPRMTWADFCQILSEDDITATAVPEGLVLSW